jgi:hypothetical protein
LDLTREVISSEKGKPSPRTKTTQFQHAFRLIKDNDWSYRRVSKTVNIERGQLKRQYEAFCRSKKPLSEYVYTPLKTGRKCLLSENSLASLRIAAHSLDGVGHPTSKPSLNAVISRLAKRRKRMSYSTLMRYRRRTNIPKKTVRNGVSSRGAKSESDFILDFSRKLKYVVNKYNIKRHQMYVFFSE